jgi:ABC-type uncharacterized transport system permease subunit
MDKPALLSIYLPFNRECLGDAFVPAKHASAPAEPRGRWLLVQNQGLVVVPEAEGFRLPEGQAQTGTLNAAIGTLGFDPVAWLVNTTTNNAALIAVGVWTSTGFAMVIISAALKGISTELLEAARVDGANELQVLRRIVIPLLRPTLTVITTTMIITALKVFDIV